ncbi:helicase-related protein [Govanella unica]|uniref:Helicase-related protein n=1 Tax=Govanella unica TaxID=2975056 RepID=A0A9X3TVP7_9PROT|nr:helicase-related protein [Govania unica]MDA5192548.1 helicase-related protein [Govania unica]
MSPRFIRPEPQSPLGVKLVLGPTNTGKTHLAVERMLAHSSGMIGLPLRLLAREIYDRVVRIKGAQAVALVTGEEKIVPKSPSYWVSTVEAMPMELDVAFIAVDEIQLCADPDRGHVFTDRLLNARGREETMFMGSEAIRPLAASLLPRADIITRPRLSTLTYVPPHKLSRLPRRSAVIAFSVTEVYGLAEMLRRQHGGAAVVMGALSPRTRNAQVELFQNGDVDYIVATDAIGMGLNMDINHVAFAQKSKFDGERFRNLTAAEIAQVAGRAGRHMTSGSFTTLADLVENFDLDLVQAVETHSFPTLQHVEWRNSQLDFATPEALIASLEALPSDSRFRRAREADDLMVLRAAAADPAIRHMARHPAAVRKLWEACQLPDFRKISPADHTRICLSVYKFLMSERGTIPNDWFNQQIKPLDRVDGDIDTLAQRIAHVRTWTYAANRPNWLESPAHWQNQARDIEDRLSDALHKGLSQRFIDRRTAVLMRELRQKERLMAVVEKDGSVTVEGHFIGALSGFTFDVDEAQLSADQRTLRQAADKALVTEISERASKLSEAEDDKFSLLLADPETQALIPAGRILWDGILVAELVAGPEALRPRIRMIQAPLLTGDDLKRVEARLQTWLDGYLNRELKPLFRLQESLELPEAISGLARGLAYQVVENLGTLSRRRVAADFRAVDKDGRRQMRSLGIWLGSTSFYLPPLLKPHAARLRLLLWSVFTQQTTLAVPPTPGLITVPTDKSVPGIFYEILGFRPIGGLAVRLDMLERLGQAAREVAEKGPFVSDSKLMSLVGVSGDDFLKIMSYLGYAYRQPSDSEAAAWAARQTEAAGETPGQTPVEVPVEAPAETPTQAPVEEPVEAPAESPVEEPVEAPAETPSEEPLQTPGETPDATAVEDVAEVLDEVSAVAAAPQMLFFREDTRRPRPDRRPERHQPRNRDDQPGQAPTGERAPDQRNRRPRQHGPRVANDTADRPDRKQPHGGERQARNDSPRSDKPRSDKPRFDKARGDKPRGGNEPRVWSSEPQSGSKRPAFNEDSPFAALASLKQSLLNKK